MDTEPILIQTEQPETGQEYIQPPEGTYFIHGIKGYKKGRVGIIDGDVVSISLQKDGQTNPIYPYGYVLDVEPGAIRFASSRDAATIRDITGEKVATVGNVQTLNYGEQNLDRLMAETPYGKHNEIVVNVLGLEIKAAYIREFGDGETRPEGYKRFMKECQETGIPVIRIPKVER